MESYFLVDHLDSDFLAAHVDEVYVHVSGTAWVAMWDLTCLSVGNCARGDWSM